MPILNWLDRDETIKVTNNVPFRLLEVDDTFSYGEHNDNMIIQGDNLEALKSLLPYYKGQVKCIYIDPPYNTKSAFEHYDDNLEHSQWLHMMYPRLELLRKFLTTDGLMFVQIDYREGARLKVILDEIMGAHCFKNEIIVRRGTKNVQSQFETIDALATGHDTIFLYSATTGVRLPKLQALQDNADPGKWDTFWRGTDRPTMRYELFGVHPETGQWRWESGRADRAKNNYERYCREYADTMNLDDYWGMIFQESGEKLDFIRKNDSNVVQYYVPPRNYKILSDVWMDVSTSGKYTDFPHEKNEELLERIIRWVTKKNEIVMDSFLGSGSTAAVAHKMGRRYIGIEIGDHAVTHVVPRMKKVVDGEQGGMSKKVNWQGGGGFRFYKLSETVFDEFGHLNPAVKFPALAAHIWFTETKTPYTGKADSPLLGIHEGTAYYLLYNGILGDKRPDSGNVLTTKIINIIPQFDGPKVIFGEASRLGEARLSQLNIKFRQTPYDIKMR